MLAVAGEVYKGNHAMDVRMMIESLAPGMQYAEKANLGAEMVGISRNLQHGLGAGSKQQGINDFLVVQCEPGKLMRQSEDDMEVADVQQLFLSLGQPAVAGVGEALGAVPVPARVIGDGAMATAGTAIQVATEGRGAAALDGAQHFELLPRQPGTVVLDEVLAVLLNDIGHLEGGPSHFFCNFRDRCTVSGLETFIVSSGLGMACR